MEHLIVPTAPHTLDAFNTNKNNYSDGESTFYLKPSDTLDCLFALTLFSYTYKYGTPYDSPDFIINTESLRNYAGFSRGGRSRNVKQDLHKLHFQTCYINGQETPLATISIRGTLTEIHSDYFHALSQAMKSAPHSRYTSLIHANIVSTRSRASAQVAIEICKLVERSSGATTPHIAVDTLISRCPDLEAGLHRAETNGKKRQYLQTTISRGIEMLSTHTSLYEKYGSISIQAPDTLHLTGRSAVIKIVRDSKD